MNAPRDTHAIRLHELDALRGIAALAVLLFHYADRFDQAYHHRGYFPYTFEVGKYGVQLFFVISGFVIFWTLERTRRASDFVVSRFSRLFPAYWAALLITYALVSMDGLPGQRVPLNEALLNLTMFPDLLRASLVDGSYWTLQVELFFYVQMLVWFSLGALRHVRWIVAGWLALAGAYAIAEGNGVPWSYTLREVLDLRYISCFSVGILMYRLRSESLQLADVALLAGAVAVATLTWGWRDGVVLTGCIGVFALLNAGRLSMLRQHWLLFLGSISYTLYLVHQEIGYILIERFERAGMHPVASIALVTLLMLGLAWAVSRLIERPAMAVLRGLHRRWRPA
jgi:peptidoglycan/LPS O-acetylase OafA/YrhL